MYESAVAVLGILLGIFMSAGVWWALDVSMVVLSLVVWIWGQCCTDIHV